MIDPTETKRRLVALTSRRMPWRPGAEPLPAVRRRAYVVVAVTRMKRGRDLDGFGQRVDARAPTRASGQVAREDHVLPDPLEAELPVDRAHRRVLLRVGGGDAANPSSRRGVQREPLRRGGEAA